MGLSAKEIMNKLALESNLLHAVEGEEQKQLQSVLVKMLSDIHLVCIENNINYSLIGGSLLGAVRHKGFIPWDDDIDIVMPRKDWECFKELFIQYLGDKYVLEAPNYLGKDSKTTWGKIYKKKTCLLEIQDINVPYETGIFVDVFVYDNTSNNCIIRRFDAFISDFLKGVATSMVYYKYPNKLLEQFYASTFSSRIYLFTRQMLGFIFSWISHRKFCNIYDRLISRHKDSGQYWTIPTGRKNYMGEMLDKSCFYPLKLVPFEDIEVFIINNETEYLKKLYGNNYMELPPVEKRERHFVVKLNF